MNLAVDLPAPCGQTHADLLEIEKGENAIRLAFRLHCTRCEMVFREMMHVAEQMPVAQKRPMTPPRSPPIRSRPGFAAARHRAHGRDGGPETMDEMQERRLRHLLSDVVEKSPYYREALGRDAAEAELADLPTLPKTVLMEEFDDIVTDPRLRRQDLEQFLEVAACRWSCTSTNTTSSALRGRAVSRVSRLLPGRVRPWAGVFVDSYASG